MDYWILFPLCPSWDLQSMILQDDFLFHTTHASYIQVRTKKKKDLRLANKAQSNLKDSERLEIKG